jgi:hypothetical protein
MRYIPITLLLFVLTSCIARNETDSMSEKTEYKELVDTTLSKKDTNERVSDTSNEYIARNTQPQPPFERIQTNKIPPYADVMDILRKSNLALVCGEKDVDQLDIDLMFLKSGTLPFDQYKVAQVKDGTERRYIDLFQEKDLKVFYEHARTYLKR